MRGVIAGCLEPDIQTGRRWVDLLWTESTRRARSLYFAVAVVAGHLLGFQKEVDGAVPSLLAVLLWALLAAVIAMEVSSLMRPSQPADDPEFQP